MIALVLALGIVVGQTAAPTDVAAAIDALGSFDFAARTDAARTVRRAPPAEAGPALARAVESHKDEYVRFRSMVLLAVIDEQAAGRLARVVLGDRNDRLRTVAYQWFEHHPDTSVVPLLIDALPRETSEFVRPALLRAIAANATDPRAEAALVPLVDRGEDFFRGAVIGALGDYQVIAALDEIADVARLEGPLQDDAVTALGRMGDAGARQVLATLQAGAEPELQPSVSAALCLLGIDCEARLAYLADTVRFTVDHEEHQPLLRGAVHALGVLAAAGRRQGLDILITAGQGAPERARAPIALGIGTVALKAPAVMLDAVSTQTGERTRTVELLLEGFDMLSEDFEEEQFYAAIRRAYWEAAEGSARRTAAELLIQRLEF
jgi:hypothetical protein